MIPHVSVYNVGMKKFLAHIQVLAAAVVLVFALCGCINITVVQPQSSGASETASAASASVSQGATSNAASASSSAASATSQTAESSGAASSASSNQADIAVESDGEYSDKEHVALYIHTYGTIPSNYVTKTKARKAGWVSSKGNLWDVLPGKSIGGGGFNNDDGLLPDAPGRQWFECDIDYEGGFRNSKRIVYSNDGLVFYTEDHYKTFEQLY